MLDSGLVDEAIAATDGFDPVVDLRRARAHAALPVLFAEFRRVLAPGDRLLLAVKAGDLHRQPANAYGHELSLDVYRVSPVPGPEGAAGRRRPPWTEGARVVVSR